MKLYLHILIILVLLLYLEAKKPTKKPVNIKKPSTPRPSTPSTRKPSTGPLLKRFRLKYFDCFYGKKSIVRLDSLLVTPNPPVDGKNSTFTFKVSVDKEITSIILRVRFGMQLWKHHTLPPRPGKGPYMRGRDFQLLINEEYKLCEGVIKCPVKPGKVVVKYSHLIPAVIAPGRYRGHASLISGNCPTKEYFCYNISN